MQSSPCWPACSHCRRQRAKQPASAGSAAVGHTSGCGGPLLRWLLQHAPVGGEDKWLTLIWFQATDVDIEQDKLSTPAGELLGLLLSGAGCCGALRPQPWRTMFCSRLAVARCRHARALQLATSVSFQFYSTEKY
jgi:hypothetical protein